MSKTKSNKKFFTGIAVAVLLPLSFYLVVSVMSKGQVKLPGHYGIQKIDTVTAGTTTKYDTTYRHTGDLTLTNQPGETISLNGSLKGKMIVLNFFFADCTSTCPKLAQSMKLLQTSFKKDPKKETTLENDIQLISISVLPERDSFPVLRAYADRIGANPDHWWFLTGDKKAIYNFARNELGLIAGQGDGGADDMLHTNKLVLLDKDRYIRGYYNGMNDTDVRKCADDVVLITLEKKRIK